MKVAPFLRLHFIYCGTGVQALPFADQDIPVVILLNGINGALLGFLRTRHPAIPCAAAEWQRIQPSHRGSSG